MRKLLKKIVDRQFVRIVKRMARRYFVLPFLTPEELMDFYQDRGTSAGVSEISFIWDMQVRAQEYRQLRRIQDQEALQAQLVKGQLSEQLAKLVKPCDDPNCETCKQVREAQAEQADEPVPEINDGLSGTYL